jgi:cysteine desulfurase
MNEEAWRLHELRDRLWAKLREGLDGLTINGSMESRLPGNLNVSFTGIDSEALVTGLDGIALSTGAACTSASVEPSHVLRALGLSANQAHAAVRFGLGRFTTAEEIEEAADRIIEKVRQLRALAPVNG